MPGQDADREVATPDDTAVPGPLRAAVGLIALEAVALLVAAGVLVVKSIDGTPDDIWRALLGAAMALAGAAALAFGARAVWQLRTAARSPIVVLQLLALPVSYSLWFQAGRVGYGAPIMIVAVAVLFLLFTPPARAVLDRDVTR